MTLFYGQNSMKSSLKSSAIYTAFQRLQAKKFPLKALRLQRSTRASKLQLRPSPSQQKEIPTAQFVRY